MERTFEIAADGKERGTPPPTFLQTNTVGGTHFLPNKTNNSDEKGSTSPLRGKEPRGTPPLFCKTTPGRFHNAIRGLRLGLAGLAGEGSEARGEGVVHP